MLGVASGPVSTCKGNLPDLRLDVRDHLPECEGCALPAGKVAALTSTDSSPARDRKTSVSLSL